MINKARRVHFRIRLRNRSARPVLSVYKTEKHIYAQVIQDNKTVASISSVGMDVKGYNISGAKVIGQKIGELAVQAGINSVVFDRGKHIYHGRIKALADSAREFLEF